MANITFDNNEIQIPCDYATQQELAQKQDVLTAGSNVQIQNNVISATDTTYTAGEGIIISNNEISVDATSEFLLKDFTQTGSWTVQPVTSGNAPTNIDVTVPADLQADWAICSYPKYEAFDSSSTRVDIVITACFSMNGQTVLRCRTLCAASTTAKTITKISGAMLLKHR